MHRLFHLKNRTDARGALLCGVALVLASCSGAPAQVNGAETGDVGAGISAPNSSTATSILNAGVMTTMGGSDGKGLKLLFDPLYDDHFGSLEQLPPNLIEAIISGRPPYDGVDAVFVSHAHGDHFSPSQLSRMMASQPQLRLIAPDQGIDRLREDANWQASFESRVTGITLENGEAVQGIEIPGAEGAVIEAFRTPHAGWPDRHAAVHNISYRVTAASGKGGTSRVMHLGDADPAAEHFTALSKFLSAKRSGLAMLPFWFYREDNVNQIIDQTLNAKAPVAIHVPAETPEFLENGELPFFDSVGETLEIPETQ